MKIFRYIAFSLGILLATSIYAQPMLKVDKYSGLELSNLKSVYGDKFQDNQNGWAGKTEYYNASIANPSGLQIKSTKYDFSLQVLKSIPNLQKDKGIQIETELQWQKGGMIGLAFGGSDDMNVYDFVLDVDNTVTIAKINDGQVTILGKGSIQAGAIANLKSKDVQKFTFRSHMGKWYFFLNEQFVCDIPAEPFFGNMTGFVVNENTQLVVKSVNVGNIVIRDDAGPIITINSIENRQGLISIIEPSPEFKVRVGDVSGVKEVRINDQVVQLNGDLYIYKPILRPNMATNISVYATDKVGNISHKEYQVVYTPTASVASTQPTQAPEERKGKYYAWFIGINQYQHWSKLYNAVEDCRAVANILTTKYQFEPQNIDMMLNEQATYSNILNKLIMLQKTLKPEDHLFIYYAGHGFYDEDTEKGYWIPVDAKEDDFPTYVPNFIIREYARTIKARNTFLVADACFSGSLLMRGEFAPKAGAISRWALTSGNMEYVPDGLPGKNSPFAKAFIEVLNKNTKSDLQADEIVKGVQRQFEGNNLQHPMGSPLKDVDEGGVFIFKRR